MGRIICSRMFIELVMLMVMSISTIMFDPYVGLWKDGLAIWVSRIKMTR